jgi:transposase
MNAKAAVFSALSVKPHKTRELIERLPYSEHTIYKALDRLAEEGLIDKRRNSREIMARVSSDYDTQKMKEIHIKALTHGIDPGVLMRDSTLAVWKQLDSPRTLKELQKTTGLSYPWVRNIVGFLKDSNLVIYEKRKPLIAVLDQEHEVNRLLKQCNGKSEKAERIYFDGALPFERLVKTPDEIERILYGKIDGGLVIMDTGFRLGGGDKLSIVESVEEELGPEEFFLHEIETPEGVEEFCVRIIASGKLDYRELLDSAKEKDMVNIVGCYLDILNGIRTFVDPEVVEEFQRNVSKRKATFLEEDREYGKTGWEEKYEERWNVDLFLDLGAIRHGLRSV